MADPDDPLAELSVLRTRLIECEQRLAVLPAYEEEARLAAADREELDSLRDRVEELESQLAESEALLAGSEAALDDMKASLSWRLTAPLRKLRRSA